MDALPDHLRANNCFLYIYIYICINMHIYIYIYICISNHHIISNGCVQILCVLMGTLSGIANGIGERLPDEDTMVKEDMERFSKIGL